MLRFLLTNLQESFASITKSSSSLQSLKNANLAPACQSSSEPCEIIDVDSYCEKNNTSANNRKRKLSCSDSSARKASKVVKLSKKMTNKKVTEFFSPVKGKSKSEESQLLPVTVVSQKKVQNDSFVHMKDFITDSFQGQLAYQTRCYECDSYTRRTEAFLDVSVPVTSTANILPGFPCEPSPRKTPTQSFFSATDVGPYSLTWALSQFALREKLRGQNKYFCDECGHFVEAERSILFSHLSSVMTIHLNRFSTQLWGLSSSVTVSKVGGNLAIPLSLSFKPWCTNDCSGKDSIYQLFAVVFHSGSSCSSGHYTACIRGKECRQVAPQDAKERFDGNGWIYFDDDQLDYMSQSELLEMMSPLSISASTVYILFYTCNA
jgi:ubiquitin C-terminal hydrolase